MIKMPLKATHAVLPRFVSCLVSWGLKRKRKRIPSCNWIFARASAVSSYPFATFYMHRKMWGPKLSAIVTRPLHLSAATLYLHRFYTLYDLNGRTCCMPRASPKPNKVRLTRGQTQE